MAETNSSPTPKHLVYDLLGQLNGAFGRVHKNLHLLNDTGVFEPGTMARLRNLAEQFRAEANCSLLETLHSIEERDREAFKV